MVAFYWFSGNWVIDGLPHIDLYYYFVPIIIVVVGAYFIADSFFDVYEMAVDTTFLCFRKCCLGLSDFSTSHFLGGVLR